MILDYQKFVLPDQKEGKGLVAEVNWNEEDINTNECKIIRFTLPDGKEIYVERKHLNEILFSIGNPKDQRRLIPVNLQTVHWAEIQPAMKANKDIHKGEMIVGPPIKISVPCTVVREMIGVEKWNKEVEKQNKKIVDK